MEVELEPRVKPLGYKVKAMSRESPAQKAAHLLDTDLRNHWSTGTNTKEWILLELDEPCLLSHIRIYNKSVLEWEISVGLRYKPETFVKVRPRCEAPRRDMMYPMNYTPCRYVRISCMRGNPIALFFVQLIGISVPGLEAEFQPVANYLLPYIMSHKQDAVDMHLQLLQHVTSRLARFLPHLEADLNSFAEAAEPTMRFLAMLAGPFYAILQIASERENARLAPNLPDFEASKINVSSTALTVSSNFEPRRSRTSSSVSVPISMHLVFRSDAVFLLLRKAYKDPSLGIVCRTASRILLNFIEPMPIHDVSTLASEIASSVPDETPQCDHHDPVALPDYSNLFGEEFQIPCDSWDLAYLNVLDSAAVEEGLMHVLYASASQPLHCSKLAENTSDLWLALPLIQALLPALRPNSGSPYQIDDKFSFWRQPFVQNALSQIVATSSSAIYCPLLRLVQAKAACVLIDLCSGVLSPWTAQVIAKVDLTIELLEDLLGVIQGAHISFSRARAALKYIVLMLSGNMDDLMAKYKEAKYQLLFLVEMLEPYLDPSLTPLKGMIAFGNVSSNFSENQENNCATAINVIRTAVTKSAVLPSLEAEWRRGSVAPSVLLSVLDPQMQLPPDIDNRKFPSPGKVEPQSSSSLPPSSRHAVISSRSNSQETTDAKVDSADATGKVDVLEDANLLFAPPEVNRMSLIHVPSSADKKSSDSNHLNVSLEVNKCPNDAALDAGQGIEFYNLVADYSQITNYRDCELRASEFRRLALNLISQNKITQESHDVAIDALLLAAECYINPYFMMYLKDNSSEVSKIYSENSNACGSSVMERIQGRKDNDLKLVADIERRRDRIVLEILIEAAKLDRKYRKVALEGETFELSVEGGGDAANVFQQDIISADAITLVRQNQELLCNFLIQHLQRDSHREQHPRHEILMWCLLFLLHSATKLFCAPEHVVDVILKFAESFNMHLESVHYQLKEDNPQLNHFKLHEVRRCWMLLQNLVIASSGNDERSVLPVNVRNGFRFSNLVPTLAWLQKIPAFSSSPFPIVRYFGWMAVARNAKQFLDERLFLVSDLPELTYLLSIFSDDLSVVDNIVDQKNVDKQIKQLSTHPDIKGEDGSKSLGFEDRLQSFHTLYPVISKFFPNLKEDFIGFGETILEAVGLQLKFLSTYMVPDLMCWFSDLCSRPFVQALSQDKPDYYKGFVAKNAKAVILYILEAIVVEHMEAMVPEIPRVVQVFVSLCRTSYCDTSFLESILQLLKPIIAYSLSKVPAEEDSLVDDSCDNFESLCFSELFKNIKSGDENLGNPVDKGKCQALTIYVLASIFGNLSFQRKTELLQPAVLWADFASSDGTNSFHDYICAYQVLMESCRDVLIATSKVWGIIPLKISPDSNTSISSADSFSKFSSWFLNDICNPTFPSEVSEEHQDGNKSVVEVSQKVSQLSFEEVKTLLKELEAIISKLNPTLEQCWRLHHKLSKKLTLTCAECLLYSRCLSWVTDRVSASSGVEDLHPSKFVEDAQDIWRKSLEGLSDTILLLQDKHCWEVASLLLDSLLGLPQYFYLDNVIRDICFAIKNFSNSAPNISWRILTDKLIQLLLARGIHRMCENEAPLVDLFCALLVHPEPEQRYIALKHLGRLVGQDVDGGRLILSSTTDTVIVSSDSPISADESILSALVTATWENVALMASSDTSLLLRTNATVLLIHFIPFAERSKLQSFLASADNILQCLTSLAQPSCYGPLIQFSLALIASIFLYCPSEDISLVPESIWRSIETLGMSKIDRFCTSLEKKACEALCRLKSDGEQAKEVLREVLSSKPPKQQLPDFLTTRESILTVIGNLTSAKSYLDFFSKEAEQKLMELEEAEMEMELLQKEHPLPDFSFEFQDWRQLPLMSTYSKDGHRLQQIKEGIRSMEKAKLREEIVAQRQQKLLLRRARQQFLEEATLREAELIQKLDRERADEVEKELERQQFLELERSKTRELRHNLEMEKEKQAQRDLQRELEQVESGVRPSRRDISSSSNTRTRDRYRERETSREGSEGSLRTSNRGGDSTATTLVGRGSFSGQLPTILQSRERTDECGSSYEENIDGSKDSGDTGSVGDPDMVSALEGQTISFGSGQRHGSRGSKSRQVIERRERDGRREGKWERKH